MSHRRQYPAYLFDLDGTLVDSAPDINAALNHSLSQQGLPSVELALTRDFVGMGSRALIVRALQHHGISDPDPEPLLQNFLSYYAEHIAVFSTPLPDTQQTLTRLRKRGARLAVVTNKYTDLTHSVLKQLDLIEQFDTIVCSETTANPKPAADPALFACAALGVAPNEALFVGDAAPDVGCARAAGCPVVVLRDGYNNGIPATQLGADAVISTIAELA